MVFILPYARRQNTFQIRELVGMYGCCVCLCDWLRKIGPCFAYLLVASIQHILLLIDAASSFCLASAIFSSFFAVFLQLHSPSLSRINSKLEYIDFGSFWNHLKMREVYSGEKKLRKWNDIFFLFLNTNGNRPFFHELKMKLKLYKCQRDGAQIIKKSPYKFSGGSLVTEPHTFAVVLMINRYTFTQFIQQQPQHVNVNVNKITKIFFCVCRFSDNFI